MSTIDTIGGLRGLAAAAFSLGAAQVAGLSGDERRLAGERGLADAHGLGESMPSLRERIEAGDDPLGAALTTIRGITERRKAGQTLTPEPIVASMIEWAAHHAGRAGPRRVIDPGTGSARFLVAAGRRWQDAELIGVETDPVAALVARANLAASGLAARSRVILGDYRRAAIPPADGQTAYLGNPPYVRHHQIPAEWKDWLAVTARQRGLPVSRLAGLHAHFFLATALRAVPGDIGVFITAAEWLEVNYGSLVRALLLGDLGGQSLHLLEPAVAAFPDVVVTSAICCFLPGRKPASMLMRRAASVAELGDLAGGHPVYRAALLPAHRSWGPLVRGPVSARLSAGHVELGEICRVHRGQVTGSNAIWVRGANEADVPGRFRIPAVTRARELFQAAGILQAGSKLRVVIDLPGDLDGLEAREREMISEFLAAAARAGAADSYIARHRRPWWRVGLRCPAPILASYMARRPPAFVRNIAGAAHLNIAHGLYPREPMPGLVLDRLAAHLRGCVDVGQGRTYAGGLTKFEPREMERIPVPWDRISA